MLVKNLVEPRPAYKLRDADETFLFHLQGITKENRVKFAYKLEVIGGNHRRLAMIELCEEDPAKFSCVESILYAGMFSVNIIPVIIWSRGSGMEL